MITIEPIVEGFVLAMDGKRVLSHSRRGPCVEIGVAENLIKRGRGSFKLRSRRNLKSPLTGFKIVESQADFAVISFDDKLVMAARQQGPLLRLSFSRFDSSINRFKLRLAAWPDERIFGCGSRSSKLDLKGERVRLWTEDRGVGRGPGILRAIADLGYDLGSDRDSSCFPVPAFVSTKDYWCAVDSSAYTIFDFRRSLTVVDSWAVPREVVLGRRDTAPAAVSDMTAFLGRPKGAPDWCYDGAWLEARGGTGELERRLDIALEAGVKVAALWSRDWWGPISEAGPRASSSLSWDPDLYPRLPETIASLRARGIRFLGYASPLFAPGGRAYDEAAGKGYLVKDSSGGVCPIPCRGGSAAMLDLTNPEAFAWIKEVLKRELLGIGMAGWLADAGEDLPPDAVLASGESAAVAHNRWSLLWAQASAEAGAEARASAGGEALSPAGPVVLARSGWLGSARYATSFWLGERVASFWKEDGLPGTVSAALSLGLSGGGCPHSEAGGSLSFAWLRRSPECLARWIEMSAFSPILRLGDGQRPESNAQFWSDPLCLESLARMSEIYAALKPYHIAVAAEQGDPEGSPGSPLSPGSPGLPPIRHPWMHYESDPLAARLVGQYLYGRDLMVAPVLEPRSGSRGPCLTELYLPDDEWIHLWTSRAFRGGKVTVESPFGCPAVFYRASSPFASLFDALRRTARRG